MSIKTPTFNNNYPIHFRLNDVIVVDGRVGTICYNSLDGCGGVWGEHQFDTSNESSYREDLPKPEFMLRNKYFEERWRQDGFHRSDVECVGHDALIAAAAAKDGGGT